jgi:hypothetical protein
MHRYSTILLIILALSTPLSAAPRNDRPEPPMTRVIRFIKHFVGMSNASEISIPKG